MASLIFLALLSFFSLTAELWCNSKPVVLSYGGQIYFPVFKHYGPENFGQRGTLIPDYKNLELRKSDWALWPVYRWDPYETNRVAPEFPAKPSQINLLGTDDRGRDIAARILYGFRYSLIFSVSVWFICSLLALVYGGICGFVGGYADMLGQRALEILSTVPQLLLLIYLISIFEPSLSMLVAVSCAFGWIGLSYFVRGEVLRTRGLEYVEAARALGAGRGHILFKCILPNCVIPLITFAPFTIVGNLTALAGLDYLGLGLPAPTPSWGELLQQSQAYFTWAWWLALYPSLILFLTLLTLTLLGEGVRVAFDPNADIVPATEAEREGVLARWIEAFRKRRPVLTPRPAAAQVTARMAVWLFLMALGALFFSTSWADPIDGSSLTMESGFYNSSDHLDHRTSKAIFMKQGMRRKITGYGATAELLTGQADWVKYEGNKASAFVSGQLSPRISYTLTAGMNRLRKRDLETGNDNEEESFEEDGGDGGEEHEAAPAAGEPESPLIMGATGLEQEQIIPYYEASMYFAPLDRLEFSLATSNDFIYNEWVDAGAASNWLAARKEYAYVEARPIDGHLWRSEGYFAEFSDRNTQIYADSAYLFTIYHGKNIVLAGPGLNYSTFGRTVEEYWSPSRFAGWSLRTESSIHLYQDFSSNLNVNIGKSQEQGQPQGMDYWAEFKINYSAEKYFNFSVSAARMESIKRGGNWSRNDLGLAFSAAL